MVDAELYLTEDWFDEQHTNLRRRLHIPVENLHNQDRNRNGDDPEG